jgi:hypothetical protein
MPDLGFLLWLQMLAFLAFIGAVVARWKPPATRQEKGRLLVALGIAMASGVASVLFYAAGQAWLACLFLGGLWAPMELGE